MNTKAIMDNIQEDGNKNKYYNINGWESKIENNKKNIVYQRDLK